METVPRAEADTSPRPTGRQGAGRRPANLQLQAGAGRLGPTSWHQGEETLPEKGYNWPRAAQRGGSGLNLISGSRSQWEPSLPGPRESHTLGCVCPDGADAGVWEAGHGEPGGAVPGLSPVGPRLLWGGRSPSPTSNKMAETSAFAVGELAGDFRHGRGGRSREGRWGWERGW